MAQENTVWLDEIDCPECAAAAVFVLAGEPIPDDIPPCGESSR